jgi:ribosomal protein L18E
MFDGKDGEIVLVIGGMLGCEENTDLKVSVSAVEAWGLV